MKKKKYEVTNCEHGKTWYLSYSECVERFGKDEFAEILQGYDPVWVAVLVEG